MFFQQIRSATIKLKYNHVVFLIDPWLRDSSTSQEVQEAKEKKTFISTPMVPLTMPLSDILDDVDYVLVTHVHSDHFTPDHLPKDIPLIFQNEKDMNKAIELEFHHVSFFNVETLCLSGITITRVDGIHGDNEKLAIKMGDVSGYIFQAENEKTVYVAGDTIFYDGVKKTIDTYHPDIIIVNACDARLTDGRLIMNEEDVVEVCKCKKDAIVIASHMDTVSHARLTREELKAYLSHKPYNQQVYIPDDGEIILF